MFGELYFDGVSDKSERGPFAVICSRGIDGNIADVYGETMEQAEAAAQYIINAVNHFEMIQAGIEESNRYIDSDHNGPDVVAPALALQPCPFCGGCNLEYRSYDISGEKEIVCLGCGVLFLFDVDFDDNQVEAAWNRRSIPDLWQPVE